MVIQVSVRLLATVIKAKRSQGLEKPLILYKAIDTYWLFVLVFFFKKV